jgi:hypothetical protein
MEHAKTRSHTPSTARARFTINGQTEEGKKKGEKGGGKPYLGRVGRLKMGMFLTV